MKTDITRSTMPTGSKTFLDHADELLAKLPADRGEILRRVTAMYLMDFKYGNKREERSACDFLNLIQAEALKIKDGAQPTKPT